MKSKGKYIPVIFLALLLWLAWSQQWWKGPAPRKPVPASGIMPNTVNEPAALNRHAHLVYTKHARCRMECRHITEAEVTQILATGLLNTDKSDPLDQPCPTYVLEGYSDEGQHIRVVFTPCGDTTRVVTCIDLDKTWNCNCQ